MRRLVVLFAALTLVLTALPAGAQEAQERPLPDLERLDGLKLSSPISVENPRASVDDALGRSAGSVQVSIVLTEPAAGDVAEGARPGQIRRVEAQQAKFLRKLEGSGGKSLGTVQRVLNAVFADVPGTAIADLAAMPEVASIKRVADYELLQTYELDLEETVPYIGGAAVQDLGYDGTGVVVAVLDSGVDYTHAALGGPGTDKAYEAAYGTKPQHQKNKKTNDVYKGSLLFPTTKVTGGYDFVGEVWPDGDLAPDPDPIDFEGHGTHVADIIAGEKGVAPGASILAVKVCSAVSSSCSGVALIQGMEYAVAEGADIINMSLGSPYGQAFDDDLAQAVENATAQGVLTVASAGNSADKPYVTGTPAAAPSALSVAQTQTPSASLQLIDAGTVTGVPAVFQPWSAPLTTEVSGELQYGDGAGGNLNGCAAFAGDLTGKIVLVDRGDCNFTLKIKNVSDAGGEAGIIGLVAPGAPFSGGDGGDRPIDIPGYMVSQVDSIALQGQVGATATIDPANQLALVGQMVGSSSRGPSMQFNLLKPEIGAPGASVSAEVGTGTGTTPFGGTSGAAPMVSGSAALLLQAEPGLIPAEVKARLINTGETEIYTDPFSPLAPVSRIGGGEVRVNRAVESSVAAWDKDALQGALSFGFDDVTTTTSYTKTILVKNYGSANVAYTITPTFRYGNDASTGAVTPSAPGSITVPAGGTAEFDLTLTVDPAKLHAWEMNSGSRGANPDPLTLNEYDGYLLMDADGYVDDLHLPWHVLPRAAGDVSTSFDFGTGSGSLSNGGVADAPVEGYPLFAVSPDIEEGPIGGQAPVVDFRFIGAQTFVVPETFCESQLLTAFAVSTWERQTHANAPALFEFDLDVDRDGTFDFAVFNADLSLAGGSFDLSDGRNVVYAQDLTTGDASVFFTTDHQTNSGLTVLYVCGEQIGLSIADLLGGPVVVDVLAQAADIYFTGAITDEAAFAYAPGYERYVPLVGSEPFFGIVAGGDSADLTVLDFGSVSDSELGVLLMFRDGAPAGNEVAALLNP